MTWIITRNSKFYLHDGESLLEGLLRTGHDINYQCKRGYCGSCRIKVVNQSQPIAYRCQTLAVIADNEVLSCCCHVEGVLRVDIDSR